MRRGFHRHDAGRRVCSTGRTGVQRGRGLVAWAVAVAWAAAARGTYVTLESRDMIAVLPSARLMDPSIWQPIQSSRIMANAAALNTTQQMVTKLRLYAMRPIHPNRLVVDIRTVHECVLPIIALLLSTTGGIAGATADALGSATFTAASANPVAPAYRCSAVNGRVGYCGHLRPALIACASLSWAHGSTGRWIEIRSNFGPNPGL